MSYSNRTPAWMNSRAFWIAIRVFGLAMMVGLIYMAVREGLWFTETVTRAAADDGFLGVLHLAVSWLLDGLWFVMLHVLSLAYLAVLVAIGGVALWLWTRLWERRA